MKKNIFRPCPVCGKLTLVKYLNEPTRCCSKECTVKLRRKTNLERYGTVDSGNSEVSKEKRRKTNLERYGVENPFQSKEIKDKIRQSNLERYGVEYACQDEAVKQKAAESFQRTFREHGCEINEKRIQTNLERYGTRNVHQNAEVIQKTKKTCLERYGVECSLHYPEFHAKVQETCIKKYGVLEPSEAAQVEITRQKRRSTCFQRYGVGTVFESKEIQDKIKQSLLEHYGVENAMQSLDLQAKAKHTNIERYGVPAAFLTEENIEKCRQAMIQNKGIHISKIDQLIHDLIQLYVPDVDYEFYLSPKWYDLILPSQKILIEINSSYTHSSQPCFYHNGLDEDYHLEKTNHAIANGYRCIHIWDWDNVEKVVQIFKPKEKVYARKCDVQFVELSIADDLIERYHLQGSIRNEEVAVGLIYKDQVISVMTFGRPRYSKKYQVELLRYTTVPEYQILGGASKLFKHFLKSYKVKSIVSYCDISKFSGAVYENLGFRLDHQSKPAKVWSKDNKYITDNLLRYKGYDQLFGTHYGKGTSNEQLMIDNGWRSVYDCGQKVYIYLTEAELQ